jgi:hypothetical protein
MAKRLAAALSAAQPAALAQMHRTISPERFRHPGHRVEQREGDQWRQQLTRYLGNAAHATSR